MAHSPYDDKIRIYSLDRILDMHVTENEFRYPDDFDPQDYFASSFGIIVDEECGIETVQIKVYGNQAKYLNALPLHRSQKEIEKI